MKNRIYIFQIIGIQFAKYLLMNVYINIYMQMKFLFTAIIYFFLLYKKRSKNVQFIFKMKIPYHKVTFIII